MKRIILGYGIISGLVVIITTLIGISFSSGDSSFEYSAWLGYLVMLVALSLIFIGVKRFRDQDQGGVIAFGKALQVGLGIAAVAGVMYVAVWEIYLVVTDYAFINHYTQSIIDARRAAGATDAEMSALLSEMEQMKAQYGNPLFRLPMTFIEIFPVGLIIAVIAAGALKKSELLPARS